MEGDNLSSTDLHLAKDDTLLIGQIAEVKHSDPTHATKQCYRRLQIWDFESGHCLKMQKSELCSASFLMKDKEQLILSRIEPLGNKDSRLVVIIWDILANELLRQINFDLPGLHNVPVKYINQSNNRFVVVGYKNQSDGNANYITFDLSIDNFDLAPPVQTSLHAGVRVTVILNSQEALTGTKIGELVIWSLRTGRPLRQLMVPFEAGVSQKAHKMEVKDLVVSKDGQYLISASADSTLKLWNLDNNRHIRDFVGHSDEVCCCAIANDNELLVSGSCDQTIRLWKVTDGSLVTCMWTGADIFKVLLSDSKKTIVGLADKHGSRKLVMMQVLRKKVKRHSESQTPTMTP